MAFTPYNPRAETHVHREKLPHWRQWGATYFVTTRLSDSVPSAIAADWRRKRDAWLLAHGFRTLADLSKLAETEQRDYHREFTVRFHALLDAGHGECILAQAACADCLIARLVAGHATAYQLDAWCIMPNHLHALVEPAVHVTLGEIVRHWKGGSSHDINQLHNQRACRWQREPFDHIVRSKTQQLHLQSYIAENPKKAGLQGGFVVGRGADVCERK